MHQVKKCLAGSVEWSGWWQTSLGGKAINPTFMFVWSIKNGKVDSLISAVGKLPPEESKTLELNQTRKIVHAYEIWTKDKIALFIWERQCQNLSEKYVKPTTVWLSLDARSYNHFCLWQKWSSVCADLECVRLSHLLSTS